MTVSSFNTVTLHPKPVISFNVHHPSETLLALQSSTRFLVHLLAPGTAAARLARDFARGNENLELGEFEWDCHNNSLPRLRRRRQHSQEEGGEKVEEDFSFVLECQYLPDKTIQVYDHMIVLGTVEKVHSASPRSSTDIDTKTQQRHDFCLTYADTRFWKMGEQVE
jgi:flavin reductase (DIM6/NTAB) family NADH-FMN oxidoreductase RutF